jgi:two-component system LytT family response regulator
MRALIVDDERLARVALKSLLDDHKEVEVVGEADSVAGAVRAITEHHPDIVFLDIEMPDGLGFDLFDEMEVEAKVVFVTAYDQHALRAFEVNALDYLVKPVHPKHVARALERVHDPVDVGEDDGAPPRERLEVSDMVCLQEAHSMKFTHVNNIVFIVSANEYTEVHLADGKVALVSQRLRRWEQRLPSCFARVHRSTLINLHHVDQITQVDGRWNVYLRERGEPIHMSRRYAKALRQQLALIA